MNLITDLQGLRPVSCWDHSQTTLPSAATRNLPDRPVKPQLETHGHGGRQLHTHLLSRADLLYSSYFCQGPLVGHNDIGATAVIHQCNAVNQKRKPSFLPGRQTDQAILGYVLTRLQDWDLGRTFEKNNLTVGHHSLRDRPACVCIISNASSNTEK